MPGCIGNDKFSFWCREIPVGHIYSYALFSFGTQAVGEKRKVNRSIGPVLRRSLKGFHLVNENILAIVQQAADQCAFAIINAPCGYKS
jgi:hypothetical protein